MDLNFDCLYPGKYLKAGLFNGEVVTYTIRDVRREELVGERGPEEKVIMTFVETPLQLVLAKLNALCIKEMFGPNVGAWTGKRVSFYGTNEIMPHPKRRNEPCIRVWGSPDIKEEIKFEWTPPRRRAIVLSLKPVVLQESVFAKALAFIQTVAPEQLAVVDSLLQARHSEGSITAEQYRQLLYAKQLRMSQQ